MLYKLAPKAYGKKSQEFAITSYNLATLYDEKGGKTSSKDEKKALKLYEQYFNLQDNLNTPKDFGYLKQYQLFMQTHYNVHKNKSDDRISQNLINLAYDLNLPDLDLAKVEFSVGLARILNQKFDNTDKYFNNALKIFIEEYGNSHEYVGEIEYWLAIIAVKDKSIEKAIEHFEKVISIYEDGRPDDRGFKENSHLYLIKIYFAQRNSSDESRHLTEYLKMTHNWIPPIQNKNIPDGFLPTVRVNPQYPARAANNGLEGFVLVDFTVDANGETKDVKAILSSHKMFERNAIKAAQRYKYSPKTINGTPVEVKNVPVKIEFRLEY